MKLGRKKLKSYEINTDLSGIREITSKFGHVKYMKEEQALILHEIINKYDLVDLLELGFFQGKSSIYIGAIMKARGKGHLTTIDLENARAKNPSIIELIEQTGYKELITPIFAHRSYTWELAQMIEKSRKPLFDFCYLDGGHTFDVTALGVSLLSILMKPGGILILDNLNWRRAGKSRHLASNGNHLCQPGTSHRSDRSLSTVLRTQRKHRQRAGKSLHSRQYGVLISLRWGTVQGNCLPSGVSGYLSAPQVSRCSDGGGVVEGVEVN